MAPKWKQNFYPETLDHRYGDRTKNSEDGMQFVVENQNPDFVESRDPISV